MNQDHHRKPRLRFDTLGSDQRQILWAWYKDAQWRSCSRVTVLELQIADLFRCKSFTTPGDPHYQTACVHFIKDSERAECPETKERSERGYKPWVCAMLTWSLNWRCEKHSQISRQALISLVWYLSPHVLLPAFLGEVFTAIYYIARSARDPLLRSNY
jgi:hypothetical protein